MRIPQDIIDHCKKHPGCRACPLGTCAAPVTNYPGEQWDDWLKERIAKVREIAA